MRKLLTSLAVSLALLATGVALVWQSPSSIAQTVTVGAPSQKTTLGYLASRFYPGVQGAAIGTTAFGGTLDTLLYVTPFRVLDYPLAATSMNVRTVTAGAAGCAIKLALWANSTATGRPTGTPLAGSNTGQTCTGSNANQTITISVTLAPGIYWAGFAYTTAAPTPLSYANQDLGMTLLTGRTALNAATTVTGMSTTVGGTFNYSGNITTLDLTSAAWTDVVGANGIPVVFLGT